MARPENFFRLGERRVSRPSDEREYKAFFGCFHVHTISMAWGVYQLLAHALALFVLMFFACRIHKAQQMQMSYMAEQQRLINSDPGFLRSSVNSADGGGMVEISSSYLLIQSSNNSFLELVVSSDGNNNDKPSSSSGGLDTSALLFRGQPITFSDKQQPASSSTDQLAAIDDNTDVDDNNNDGPSMSAAASWGHLQLTEGKITARELRLGFFATLMALLTVGMFLYGIISKKPLWMIPHFALQVLDVIIGAVTFIGVVCYAPRIDRYFHLHYAAMVRNSWPDAAADTDADVDSSKIILAERVMLAFLLFSMFLLLVLKSYVLGAIFRCMYYFMDLRAQLVARRTSTITGSLSPRAHANGYAELGPVPFDEITNTLGDKSVYATNITTTASNMNKKNSLPRYESAVAAEYAGIPPPPYEEKQ